MALVSIEDIRSRLRIDEAYSDADLMSVADEASDIVVNYAKKPGAWTPETVPYRVRTAILLVCQNIIDQTDEPLSGAVKNLLHRDRDPALV